MRPFLANPVHMIGNRLDVAVDVWIEVLTGLPLVSSALDHLVEMLDDAGGHKRLTVIVEVESPRIAGAFGEHFKRTRDRMETPDAGIQSNALRVGCSRLTDIRLSEDAMRPVEPAIRTPRESVERFVRVLISPSVEHDLRRPGRRVGAGRDRDEQQIGGRANPDTTEPDFNSTDQIQVLGEHLAAVEAAIAIGVFENQDSITAFTLRRA